MAAAWRLEYDERSARLVSWEHPAAGQPIQRKATPVDGNELTALTARWRSEYRTAGCDLESIGAKLWQFLAAHAPVGEMRKAGNTVRLLIDAEGVLAEWPWEILHDGSGFTLLSDSAAIEPVRWLPGSAPNLDPANRPLRVLFMAASAEGVKPVLDHEGEERAILDGARKNHAGIDLVVEDTGSIEGLGYRLAANGAREDCADVSWYDIVHVSGHADVSTDGPVFILETELGERDNVEPPRLIDTFGERWPRLTFLSGCSTARDNGTATRGMATAIVRAGAPLVLGWALPVGDAAATAAAAVIYAKLAENHAPDRAIRLARKALFNAKSKYWHLLRVVARDVPQKSFVTAASHPGRAVLRNVDADQEVEYFDSEHEESGRVCPRGRFVGRRRPLQRTTSVLRHGRALGQTDSLHRPGVVIHGLGGQGKSSLGCRLLDRFRDHLRVILVGRVDEPMLIRKLGEKVQAIAPPPLANGRAVMDVLQDSSLTFVARMEQIVRHPATSKLLLVFDDFEANVERIASESVTYRQLAIDVVTACATAIRSTNSSSRVILTSWHGVPLCGPGWKLESEHLEPLSPEDQEKKLVHLPALRERRDEDVAVEAIRLAGGNPRLLEYFDRCLADGNTDPAALLEAVRAASPDHRLDRFVERLVNMIETQQPGFESALSRLAIVELPAARAVALATIAMGSLGNDLLDRGAALGLVEAAIAVEDRQPRYLVPPIVRALVSKPDATAASRAADAINRLSWRGDTDARLLELIRLARQGGRVSLTADAMGVLATRWLTKDRFRDACTLCRDMPADHGDFKLSIAAGRAEAAAGTATKAGEHFAHAWQLTDKAAEAGGSLDDRDLANAEVWFSEWLVRQGKNDDAEPLVRRAAERFEKLCDVRSRAITLGKIADIYQARGDLDGALKIRQEEQLPVFEKLGDVRALLMARANIALTMLARNRQDDVPEIVSLLVWSYRTAAERGFAEAVQLEQILRKLGIDSR